MIRSRESLPMFQNGQQAHKVEISKGIQAVAEALDQIFRLEHMHVGLFKNEEFDIQPPFISVIIFRSKRVIKLCTEMQELV